MQLWYSRLAEFRLRPAARYGTNGAMSILRRFAFLLAPFFAYVLLAQVPAPTPVPAPPVKPPPVAPGVTADHSQESYVVEKLRNSFRFESDGTGRREI